MTHTICSVGFLLYLCEMETKEQLFRDVTFSLNIPDDIYQKAMSRLNTERIRYKMGGDEGIHSIEHDPPISSGPQFVK
jgi:hypothetical protein